MSPFTDFLETIYGTSLELSQLFLAHSISAKNICQMRSKAKMKGEMDNKDNALEPINGSESFDISDGPHNASVSDSHSNDVSEPRNGSDGCRDDISEFDDASEPDDESECRNIAVDFAKMACDTSNGSIAVGNDHAPGSGTWWGQHAISGTDTEKQWRNTTADVQRVLQAMAVVSSKRPAPHEVLAPSKKR